MINTNVDHLNTKTKLELIDGCFENISMHYNESGRLDEECLTISQLLKSIYKYDFNVKVVSQKSMTLYTSPLFVMSVYPQMSTIEKISESIINGKSSAISTVWKSNKKWVIEIDARILNPDFISLTPREMTAILLHEIGHVADSNAVTTRISNIVSYQVAQSPTAVRLMMNDGVFRRILSLPILNACILNDEKDNAQIRHEIKADKFVRKVGYGDDLKSALEKLIKCRYYPKSGNMNDNMKKTMTFSTDIINQFSKRHDALVKKSLLGLKEECTSPYLSEAVQWVYDGLYTPSYYIPGRDAACGQIKLEKVHERADELIDMSKQIGPVMEVAGSFPYIGLKKKLKRIEPDQIDYIEIKIEDVHDNNDKLIILTYINSKLDIIDYYIDILSNPRIARKYIIPHTLDELKALKIKLELLKEKCIKKPLPKFNDNLVIAWPKGYEG